MIDEEKRYEFITSQIRYHNEKMIEAFNRFIQLFAAITGGSIWVAIQSAHFTANGSHYWVLADALVLLLAAITCLNIISDLLAWFGYREAESNLVGVKKLKPPHWLQYAMLLGIVGACLAFCVFNPLAA